MGILEMVLIFCVVLKLAGVAFAGVSYLVMFGYYGLSVVVLVAALLTAGVVATKLGDK